MNLSLFIYYSNLFSLEIQNFSVLNCTFVPILVYPNADENKLQIFSFGTRLEGSVR